MKQYEGQERQHAVKYFLRDESKLLKCASIVAAIHIIKHLYELKSLYFILCGAITFL